MGSSDAVSSLGLGNVGEDGGGSELSSSIGELADGDIEGLVDLSVGQESASSADDSGSANRWPSR